MKLATVALAIAHSETIRNTTDVLPPVSMKWPMVGSPKPANRYAKKFMMPVAVPARLCPTRSGHNAQNDDCGP